MNLFINCPDCKKEIKIGGKCVCGYSDKERLENLIEQYPEAKRSYCDSCGSYYLLTWDNGSYECQKCNYMGGGE